MTSTLATNAAVEALANTGLADAALELLIDAADALIVDGYGAHDTENTTDIAKRKWVLVDLVKIMARYSGVKQESLGSESVTPYDWAEVRRVINRLRSGVIVDDGDDDE